MPATAVSPPEHLDWVKRLARKVARAYRLRGQELDDLVQVGVVKLLERIASGEYSPARAVDRDPVVSFRVWVARSILGACRDEAVRLRAGGLIRRRVRPENLVVADPLGDGANGVVKDDDGSPPVVPDGACACKLVDVKGGTYGRAFRWGRKV